MCRHMHTDIYEAHAAMCRIFTHPARLQIIDLLGKGESSVTAITGSVGIGRPTVSQHLAVLREQGVVRTRRSGTTIYYSIADPRIIDACRTMRAVLIDRMRGQGLLASRAEREARRRHRIKEEVR
ncbi:MAG: hypothetical protein A2X36_14255 [Elusimicrobia bacterium GWA2_69_24]|nr:MAG: hypothetical protein A2X36_14255 [Elusimicrobia bacterium GWA2_69_24]